jgi:hypothetical protein
MNTVTRQSISVLQVPANKLAPSPEQMHPKEIYQLAKSKCFQHCFMALNKIQDVAVKTLLKLDICSLSIALLFESVRKAWGVSPRKSSSRARCNVVKSANEYNSRVQELPNLKCGFPNCWLTASYRTCLIITQCEGMQAAIESSPHVANASNSAVISPEPRLNTSYCDFASTFLRKGDSKTGPKIFYSGTS